MIDGNPLKITKKEGRKLFIRENTKTLVSLNLGL